LNRLQVVRFSTFDGIVEKLGDFLIEGIVEICRDVLF